MPAWQVTKLWTDKEIGEYRAYAAKEGPRKAGQLRSTCEDLAIRLVTEFASANGLPIYFTNRTHPFPESITPERFGTAVGFLTEVLTTTAARDLDEHFTAKLVPGARKADPTSLRLARPGDLILHNEPSSHVQVVTAVLPQTVKIAQGNFRPSGERAGLAARGLNRVGLMDFNQNNPNDSRYIGAIVREKSYDLDRVSGKWVYDGQPDLFRTKNCRLMGWYFEAWNSRAARYEVKAGDTTNSVLKAVYGKDLTPHRVMRSVSVFDGRYDAKGALRPGSVIYFWK